MEPAYTTIDPLSLYPVGDLALDYDETASANFVMRHTGPEFARPVQGLGHVDRLVPGPYRGQPVHGGDPAYERPAGYGGFGGFGAVDVRPYVTFYTQAGAVPVAVDPTTVLSGNVVFPVVGAVPYDLDIISFSMILHVPVAGDVAIPLGVGGGGGRSKIGRAHV